VLDVRSRRAPGPPARYSNLGYLLLADAIADAARQPFEAYVRSAVLDPAGMHSTGYVHDPPADHATGNVQAPHPAGALLRLVLPRGIVGSRHGHHITLKPFRVVGTGYGGPIGDVSDAARLLRLHLGDGTVDRRRVLRPETAQAMRRIATPGKPFDLGLGWFRRPADRAASPTFVEHCGTGGGFWNIMRLYPDLDLGIVIMANTTQAPGSPSEMPGRSNTGLADPNRKRGRSRSTVHRWSSRRASSRHHHPRHAAWQDVMPRQSDHARGVGLQRDRVEALGGRFVGVSL
jgi:CubicO group peptidase (beta-lactamase class C family)